MGTVVISKSGDPTVTGWIPPTHLLRPVGVAGAAPLPEDFDLDDEFSPQPSSSVEALTQLVSLGAVDTLLTGKPPMTFFRCVYRQHTNFALEAMASIDQPSGSINVSRSGTPASQPRSSGRRRHRGGSGYKSTHRRPSPSKYSGRGARGKQ